ncbi:MAG: WYL domain-containing protein [Oscillospiraceae bacterium]|nr:WYL domain-containing protein [Oscillospiraceae bacterium]
MPNHPKKTLILNILDILRRYTDEEHRLSQKEIAEILRTEYGMTAERKTIRRHLLNLIDCGYEIEYSESVRMVPNRKAGELEESYLWSDFYLVRDFTDAELRLLIDGLLFSKHVPYSQCRELVQKLEGLSNRYFRSRVKFIRTLPDNAPQNRQLFYTIDVIDEAIGKGKKISFRYTTFGTDKKRRPRLGEDGKPKEYVVSPYQMAAANGRYYLIACTDPHDNVSHYRLDRIADVRLTDEPVRPAKTVQGLEKGVDLPKHMAEHLYMFAGKSETVTFRMKKYLIDDVIDWFGADVTFSDENEDAVTARVRVNLQAMRRWAVQYAPHVRVLTPDHLVEAVKTDLQTALEQYR